MDTTPSNTPWRPPARRLAYGLVWLACLGVAGGRIHHARTAYDTPTGRAREWVRPGGNSGHVQIDFGGQWVLARMVATGNARELYDRNRLWDVVREGYPTDREEPARRDYFPTRAGATDPDGKRIRHDADNLMFWFMGHGNDSARWQVLGNAVALPFAADAVGSNLFAVGVLIHCAESTVTPELATELNTKVVGGPLYPPVHGFLFAWLGLFADPSDAYTAMRWAGLAAAFVAGWGAASLSRWRVWWPVATSAILLFPGCRAALDLGQNATITLAIVLVGWALTARGRDRAGGAVWGLLAFKPVWAAAFLVVPLLAGRWRFTAAMAVSGIGLVGATLPFTGLEPWLDWLTIGREASVTYDVNKNWVELSRDLHGIPRRMMLDFRVPVQERHSPTASRWGWVIWGVVLIGTTAVYRSRANRNNVTGLGIGFLFLGAYLTCYRFMYYDALLAAAGVAVLFADPPRLVGFTTGRPRGLPFGPRWAGRLLAPPVLLLVLLFLFENEGSRYRPRVTFSAVGTPEITAEIGYYHPWETVAVLALWWWCGWRLLWGPDLGEPVATDEKADHRPRS